MEELSFDFEFEDEPQAEKVRPPNVPLTVSELTSEINHLLSSSFDDVRVTGEISGYRVWSSGHAYFSLKDESALLKCVLFRSTLRYLKVKPAEGMAVVARGYVEVRADRGEYQLIVQALEPQGAGALMLAFEQLKKRLAEEGLFDQDRKRPLPAYPRRIGIVTSPQGAVIRDMLSVLRRRWPGLHIRLYPSPVQGEGAVETICEGIDHFSRSGWADVVIVGRGGGSLEDLWAFNDEAVARAIRASAPPVISAVGHETDFTIADFVADLRAPTPSAAAELVVKDQAEVRRSLDISRQHSIRSLSHLMNVLRRRLGERGVERATRLLQTRIGRYQQRVDESAGAMESGLRLRSSAARRRLEDLDRRLRQQDLRLRLARARARLDQSDTLLQQRISSRLSECRRLAGPLHARLEALSPLAVLDRGYAVVQTPEGAVVSAAAQAPPGTDVKIRLARGRLGATVTESSAVPGA